MRRITIQYHHEGDGWWAESPDVAGFSAAAPSFNELRQRTVAALEEIVDSDEPIFLDERPPLRRLPQPPDTAGPVQLEPAASA